MKVKTILVSQPEPKVENSPYFELQQKHKIKIDFRPFIHVEGVNAKEIRLQKIDLNHYTAIILTSRNAVDHFFRVADEMRYKVPEGLKYFCQSDFRTSPMIRGKAHSILILIYRVVCIPSVLLFAQRKKFFVVRFPIL